MATLNMKGQRGKAAFGQTATCKVIIGNYLPVVFNINISVCCVVCNFNIDVLLELIRSLLNLCFLCIDFVYDKLSYFHITHESRNE